jgi:hypothetical protein
MVSKNTLETGDVTSQPGSPGQPRVAPYQRDSPYLRVPPDFGVTAVDVGVLEAVGVVADVPQAERNRLKIIRIESTINKYFLIIPLLKLFFLFT